MFAKFPNNPCQQIFIAHDYKLHLFKSMIEHPEFYRRNPQVFSPLHCSQQSSG